MYVYGIILYIHIYIYIEIYIILHRVHYNTLDISYMCYVFKCTWFYQIGYNNIIRICMCVWYLHYTWLNTCWASTIVQYCWVLSFAHFIEVIDFPAAARQVFRVQGRSTSFVRLTDLIWLVVYLPLWKIWVSWSQLGWLFPRYGNIKKKCSKFQTTNRSFLIDIGCFTVWITSFMSY